MAAVPTAAASPTPAYRPARDHRTVLNGMLWVLRTGAPWRDLPAPHGKWQIVYSRFRRWRAAGMWDEILRILPWKAAYTHRRWSTGRYATTRADLDADWAQLDQLFGCMEMRA